MLQCFAWVSEEAENISLKNINWLIFITEIQGVYKLHRTEIRFIFFFKLLTTNLILEGNNTA